MTIVHPDLSPSSHSPTLPLFFKSIFVLSSIVAIIALQTSGTASAPGKDDNIGADSIELSAASFLQQFSSRKDTQRERARLFLLGVQEASEGKSWCGYRSAKSVELREEVYEYLKKLPKQRMQERAAVVIEEALVRAYPCKRNG